MLPKTLDVKVCIWKGFTVTIEDSGLERFRGYTDLPEYERKTSKMYGHLVHLESFRMISRIGLSLTIWRESVSNE